MIFNKYVKLFVLSLTGFLIFGCSSKNKSESKELVRINDKVITDEEFLYRCEYTVRPAWCRNDNYVHKKVALNSLIAEKLLAIEAGMDTPVDKEPEIQSYLQGRKEQEMRQLHFQRTAVDNVDLDQQIFSTALKNSERIYQVDIIPIGDNKIAKEITRELKTNELTFSQIKEEVSKAGGTVQDLELRFDSPLDDRVYKQLFQSENIKKGQVIGPLQLDENAYTLIRVNSWTRHPLMSGQEQELRFNDVREKESNVAALDIYEEWIRELMKGKQLNFNKDVLKALVEAVAPLYFKAKEKSAVNMQKSVWQHENKDQINISDIANKVDAIDSQPLFEIDGHVWTVAQFEEELKVHPLVFRNPKMSKRQFGEQFRLAIADMVRDMYITEDAYKKGYDKNVKLQHRCAMWKDNLKAEYMKEHILKEAGIENTNDLKTVENILNPYIENLFKKYSGQIHINFDLFESIELTDIDIFVIQENVPFPVYVPEFPCLTTYNRLDYGRVAKGE